MIRFSTADDNKQFLSIKPLDSTTTEEIIKHLQNKLPTITDNDIFDFDEREILINLYPAISTHYDFSGEKLKKVVKAVSNAEVRTMALTVAAEYA